MRIASMMAVIAALVLLAGNAAADDAADIKKLIPAATAMAQADFEKLATSATAPKASDVDEKSLTLLLFSAASRDDEDAKKQFRFLTDGVPKPATLAKEIYRAKRLGKLNIVLAPVTMIHAERIQEMTCEVEGDTARGAVKYEVPQLYAGQFDYVARKVDGKWRIADLAVPAYDIHIVRGESGKWEEK